jgi:hypothetical protein
MGRNLLRNGLLILFPILFSLFATTVHAQDNYEIQVYGSDLVEPKTTMLELHSNFTFDGSTEKINGVLPTNHVFHETVEVTHGFNKWFEVGFYFFNAIGNDGRTSYVGSHIRPRIAIPKSYDLPVGLSFSTEVGFQNSKYSEDTWTIEIRPIIDKQWSKLYLAFNPTFDRSLKGLNTGEGFVFSPNFKASYAVTKAFIPGFEYYGSIGPLNNVYNWGNQQQQLFLAVDLDIFPKWEFNAGYGLGFTSGTDKNIFKVIVGRRLK